MKTSGKCCHPGSIKPQGLKPWVLWPLDAAAEAATHKKHLRDSFTIVICKLWQRMIGQAYLTKRPSRIWSRPTNILEVR